MATRILPVQPGVEDQSVEVQLDGRLYSLRLQWDGKSWYLTLTDADGAVLRAGIRVVANWPLLRLGVDPRLPPGELMALRTAGDADPVLEELGSAVSLVYAEARR